MHKDMVAQAVLDSQREAVEKTIPGISLGGIHIMRRKHDLFPEQPVIQHQQCTIYYFEPVIPEDVKDLRLGSRGVADKPAIVNQNPQGLPCEAHVLSLVPAQIQKGYEWRAMQLGSIHRIATNEIQEHTLRD